MKVFSENADPTDREIARRTRRICPKCPIGDEWPGSPSRDTFAAPN